MVIGSVYNHDFYKVDPRTDAVEYKFVAKSILDGKGYISNENNFFERPSLGDNYYYSDSPVYPLIISFFYFFSNSDFLIIFISNSIFQIILFSMFWALGTELKIHRSLLAIATFLIISHSAINFYSVFLLSEAFRTAILTATVYFSYLWLNNHHEDRRNQLAQDNQK